MPARTPREADLRTLWELVFGDSPQAIESFFTPIYREEEALALYLTEELGAEPVSMLLAPRLDLRVEGELQLPIGYLCGVCTHPAHEGKGYSGRLLLEALRLERERGDIFSSLIPASPRLFDFYARKAGFFPAFSEYTTDDEGEYLARASYRAERADLLSSVLSTQEHASEVPSILHPAPWWDAVLADYTQSEGYLLLPHRDAEGKVDGALFAMIRTDRELWIRALFGSEDVQRDLLSKLHQRYPQASCRYYLPSPADSTPRPKGMARLLHLGRLLQRYGAQHPEASLTFAYHDPLFPEEDSYYELRGGEVLQRPLAPSDQPLDQQSILHQLGLSPLHWRAYLLCEGEL